MIDNYLLVFDDVGIPGWVSLLCTIITIATSVFTVFFSIKQNKQTSDDVKASLYLSLVSGLSDMRVCVGWIKEGSLPPFDLFEMDTKLAFDLRRMDARGFFCEKAEITEEMTQRSKSLSTRLCRLSELFKELYRQAEKIFKDGSLQSDKRSIDKLCDDFNKEEAELNVELAQLLKRN